MELGQQYHSKGKGKGNRGMAFVYHRFNRSGYRYRRSQVIKSGVGSVTRISSRVQGGILVIGCPENLINESTGHMKQDDAYMDEFKDRIRKT
jgi:hypothetical protein